MKQPSRRKGAAAPSRLNRFHDRLVAMCIVETTAGELQRHAFVEDRTV